MQNWPHKQKETRYYCESNVLIAKEEHHSFSGDRDPDCAKYGMVRTLTRGVHFPTCNGVPGNYTPTHYRCIHAVNRTVQFSHHTENIAQLSYTVPARALRACSRRSQLCLPSFCGRLRKTMIWSSVFPQRRGISFYTFRFGTLLRTDAPNVLNLPVLFQFVFYYF